MKETRGGNKKMTKKEFLEKHNFEDADWRNLVRFENVRLSGVYNMCEYMNQMAKYNTNGGKKIATWIERGNNYEEFLEIFGIESERERKEFLERTKNKR